LVNESEEEVRQWVEDTEGMSIAHLKELFVANKVLGDPYPQALEVLRKMKATESSSSFDDYEVVDAPIEMKADWSDFGSGKVYREAKKRQGNVIFGIADDIDELI
jgi:hypothetical protein